MHGFARCVASPKGFVLRAAGFRPAVRVVRQPAVGRKPAATATKAGTQRVPGGLSAKPCITPIARPNGVVYWVAAGVRESEERMQSNQSSWEGTILIFALLFTVLMGVTYGAAIWFRTPIPWFANLVVAMLGALALRYLRRP